MYVSYKWLQDYVDLTGISPEELAEKITRTGIEVEDVEKKGEKLKKIVVGHVLTCEDHPNSDHLHLCQVDIGEEEPVQIVLRIEHRLYRNDGYHRFHIVTLQSVPHRFQRRNQYNFQDRIRSYEGRSDEPCPRLRFQSNRFLYRHYNRRHDKFYKKYQFQQKVQ